MDGSLSQETRRQYSVDRSLEMMAGGGARHASRMDVTNWWQPLPSPGVHHVLPSSSRFVEARLVTL